MLNFRLTEVDTQSRNVYKEKEATEYMMDRKYTEEKSHKLSSFCSIAMLDSICSCVLMNQAVTNSSFHA